MLKKTSIKNIANILCYDPMAEIVKAEYRYKALPIEKAKNTIDTITMLESISSLEDNIVFDNVVDWTYENVSNVSDLEDVILYGDLHEPTKGTIVVVHLRVVNDHTVEHIVNELEKNTLIIQKITEEKEKI